MEAHEKTEEELIGTLVKLRKRTKESYDKIEALLKYDGEFHQALKEKWESGESPDRWFKAKMSVNPDKIIELAEKLRSLQKEYNASHQELREFENKNAEIVEKYGDGHPIY